jgi:hypothetical protein
VWVGFDDNSPLIGPNGKGLTGANAAAPIWGMYMKKIHKEIEKQEFKLPEKVRYQQVNYHNGFLSPDKSKDTIRIALHSGVALPVIPASLIETNIQRVNSNRSVSSRQPQWLPGNTDSDTDEIKKERLVVASMPKLKPVSKNLKTKIWYLLNLKQASLGQSKRIPTSFLVNFLVSTKENSVNGADRVNQARSIAIDHLYQSLGSLRTETIQGYSLRQIMNQSEVADFIKTHQ